MYTVKQLSDLAGVTARTLHYYDQIGLLKPSVVGGNGYRYYGEEALFRLQQILFYRELDMPLQDIKKMMGRRDFDVLTALESHRSALQGQVERVERLIQTVDQTILHLKGRQKMNPKNLFDGFSEQEEKHYEEQAMQMYDPETVKSAHDKWKNYSTADKERIGSEGNAIYKDMIAVMEKNAEAPEVQAIVARWHKHLEYFWSPNDEQLLGLGDLYNTSPDFFKNFEVTKPGLAVFMKKAIVVYVKNRNKVERKKQ